MVEMSDLSATTYVCYANCQCYSNLIRYNLLIYDGRDSTGLQNGIHQCCNGVMSPNCTSCYYNSYYGRQMAYGYVITCSPL